MDKIDSNVIYNELDELTKGHQLDVGYVRTIELEGELKDHKFILKGWVENNNNCNEITENFFVKLSNFITKYKPKQNKLHNSTKGYISIIFDKEKLKNYPPEPDKKYNTHRLSGKAKNNFVYECSNCQSRTDESIPPLKIKYKSKGQYMDCDTEELRFCTDCSPVNYDKVARHWNGYGVDNNTVTHVLARPWKEYDDNRNLIKEHDEKWISISEIENISYTKYVIKVIERYLEKTNS